MSEVLWLEGAAPTFDDDVTRWLVRQGVSVSRLKPLACPRRVIPMVTKWRRLAGYRAILRRESPAALILPYLAGDTLLLAEGGTVRTLGVAIGSDVLRRSRDAAREGRFSRAIRRLTGVWAVSSELGQELAACGRPPDIVAPVGVDLASLSRLIPCVPEPGRIVSARREAPIYRRSLVREALDGWVGVRLIEARDWPRERLLAEMASAELVVSIPETDGAPATVMEALCLGAHVVASGGTTVARWLRVFGGTYGEPVDAPAVRSLLVSARRTAGMESQEERRVRAQRAQRAFDRDSHLSHLLHWLRPETSVSSA